jgi:intein/homing endonuclease
VNNGDKTLSMNNNTGFVECSNVNYIMKHKVNKEIFEIKIGTRKVIVTEDHSIIVLRNNNLVSCKPKEILKTDKLIYIKT